MMCNIWHVTSLGKIFKNRCCQIASGAKFAYDRQLFSVKLNFINFKGLMKHIMSHHNYIILCNHTKSELVGNVANSV